MQDVAVMKAILDPMIQLASLVLIGLAPVFANYLIQVLHNRFKLDLTAAQDATVRKACLTGAGVLLTQLTRGAIQLEHLHVDDPNVIAAAQVAINAVPDAAGAFNLTIPDLAHMIVGQVGQVLGADPTTPTVGTPTVQIVKAMPAAPATVHQG